MSKVYSGGRGGGKSYATATGANIIGKSLVNPIHGAESFNTPSPDPAPPELYELANTAISRWKEDSRKIIENGGGYVDTPPFDLPNSCFNKKQNEYLISVVSKHNTEMKRLILARKLAQWLVNGDETTDVKPFGWEKVKMEDGAIGAYPTATEKIIQAEQVRKQMEQMMKHEEWKFRESERLQQEMMLKYPPMIGLTTTAPKSWK